jgi:N-carbamoyl-L-amino-acid hydrolase
MSNAPPVIDVETMFAQFDAINAINRQPDGSCCRLALTDADRAGRDLVTTWMREADLEVSIDQIGNIVGIQRGVDGRAPIMTGSHIDTVATGGPLDGTLGVLAGLAVVRACRTAGVATRHPLAVTVFTNEEGARFQPDMMGSLVYAGGMALSEALAARSEDDVVLGDELTRIGYAGRAPCGEVIPRAYVELHIEQGPILDREHGVLGAVEDLQGISWQEVIVRGVSNHAGTTPMEMRRDAAFCASSIVVFVRDLANRMGGRQVATVGSLRIAPNLANVIAREARLVVDLRNTSDEMLRQAEAALHAFLAELSSAQGVEIETHALVRTEPVRFDPDVVATVERVARAMGQPCRRMTSGAGHDAQMMARICPAGMIFVPSISGISHNPKEETKKEHLVTGSTALLLAMLELANG